MHLKRSGIRSAFFLVGVVIGAGFLHLIRWMSDQLVNVRLALSTVAPCDSQDTNVDQV